MSLPWYRHDWGHRTLADEQRDNPKPPSEKPHAHFHEHGGSRHSHDHDHATDRELHAHSALLTTPRHT